MAWCDLGLWLCLSLLLAAVCGWSGTAAAAPGTTLLVETEWLASQLHAPRLRLVDLRALPDYQRAHIPQAVHLEPQALVERQQNGSGPRLSAAAVTALMARLGIGHTTRVVAYDDQGGLHAARLWWLLTAYGHAAVQVLNGGWPKWQREQRPDTTEVPHLAPAPVTLRLVPQRLATREDIMQTLGTPHVLVVDARSRLEYQGWVRYAARAGHIPGAVHLEWKRALQRDGTFLPPEKLQALVQHAGVSPDKRVITYCQAGVRAAHLAFVLALLGYPDVAVYDGSWDEWGNDPHTPVE